MIIKKVVFTRMVKSGFRNVMVGNNSASVVSDAYIKGLRGYDNTLYEAL
jgi:hypothetical protein